VRRRRRPRRARGEQKDGCRVRGCRAQSEGFRCGLSKYLGPRYTQHNPNAADGPEGLRDYIAFLKDKFPNNRSEIKRIFADGDYVIVHVHAVREPGTRGNAIIDIFKLENGKVVEHWDVIQPIPEKAANDNGMF